MNEGATAVLVSIGYQTGIFEAMLQDAGFSTVEVKELEEDPFNAYFVATK